MAWDFQTDPAFEEDLAWMREFMRDNVWPLESLAGELDRDRFFGHIRDLQQQVRKRGLWATHLGPEHGGQGHGQVKLALMHEVEGTSIFVGPIVFGNQAPDSGNAEILARYGTDHHKQWLEPLLAGEIFSAFSMTEPFNAGSDPVVMSTIAELDGDEWVINGHKWFTSGGMVAEFLIVMAQTDSGALPHERASMIVVPRETPGVRVIRNVPTMGGPDHYDWGHAEVIYENVRVPVENLLGERGSGFAIAQARLGPGRIHHCMRWLGQSQRAFDILCERSLQRQVRGEALASKQTVQNWIADSYAEMQAARLLTLHAAWTIDTKGVAAARKEISLIKFFGARIMHDVIDRSIQVCGALGYTEDLPLAAMYRFARGARIYDGADEVHRESLARQLLRDYQAPEGLWPTDHLPTHREVGRKRFN